MFRKVFTFSRFLKRPFLETNKKDQNFDKTLSILLINLDNFKLSELFSKDSFSRKIES